MLEAEITGGLEHPGIVPVYGLGQYAKGRPFYAMRFIRGDSLKEAIERFHKAEGPGREPGERALACGKLLGRFVDVCNAIAYAHSRGVLHRDLKPGNIMLGQYGETLVVDWGLAKPGGAGAEGVPDSSQGHETGLRERFGPDAQMGSAIGTPSFMSPEQAAGRLDRRAPPVTSTAWEHTVLPLDGQGPVRGCGHRQNSGRGCSAASFRPRGRLHGGTAGFGGGLSEGHGSETRKALCLAPVPWPMTSSTGWRTNRWRLAGAVGGQGPPLGGPP